VGDSDSAALAWLRGVVLAVASIALGALAGFLVTLGLVVLKARVGSFIYDVDEMLAFRWETAPILVGIAGALWIGVRNPLALGRAVVSGIGGILVGVGLGAAAGALVSATPEGLWSGMIIGGVGGMVVAGAASLALPAGGVTFGGSRASSGMRKR